MPLSVIEFEPLAILEAAAPRLPFHPPLTFVVTPQPPSSSKTLLDLYLPSLL